jgi:hypothetical protein
MKTKDNDKKSRDRESECETGARHLACEAAVGSSTPELLNFSYERTENVYENKG